MTKKQPILRSNSNNQLFLKIFLVATLACVLFVTSALAIKESTINRIITSDNLQQILVTHKAANILNQEFDAYADKLSLVALYPEVRDGTPKECTEKILEVKEILSRKIGSLGRINSDMIVDCSSDSVTIGANTSKVDSVKSVFTDQVVTLGRVSFSKSLNQPLIAMHTPILKDEKLTGSIGFAIYLNKIHEDLLLGTTSTEHSYLMLVDDNGDVISFPEDAILGKNINSSDAKAYFANEPKLYSYITNSLAVKDQQTGQLQNLVFKNKKSLATYSRAEVFPNRYWYVFAISPRDQVYTAITTLLQDGNFSPIEYIIASNIAIVLFSTALLIFLLPKKIKFFKWPTR